MDGWELRLFQMHGNRCLHGFPVEFCPYPHSLLYNRTTSGEEQSTKSRAGYTGYRHVRGLKINPFTSEGEPFMTSVLEHVLEQR